MVTHAPPTPNLSKVSCFERNIRGQNCASACSLASKRLERQQAPSWCELSFASGDHNHNIAQLSTCCLSFDHCNTAPPADHQWKDHARVDLHETKRRWDFLHIGLVLLRHGASGRRGRRGPHRRCRVTATSCVNFVTLGWRFRGSITGHLA